MSVKSSIKSITKSLESIQDDRTYLIKHTRDAVSLCSQSIIAVHGQDLPTAKKKAAEASFVKKYRPKAVTSISSGSATRLFLQVIPYATLKPSDVCCIIVA